MVGEHLSGTVVIGAQWGDEGKGKVTDFLARDTDIVVRYQGGNNAGHTVVVKGEKISLHHLPSGVVYGKKSMMAAGMVLDPAVLVEEIEKFGDRKCLDLVIDPRIHIIMPWHKLLDSAEEGNGGNNKNNVGVGGFGGGSGAGGANNAGGFGGSVACGSGSNSCPGKIGTTKRGIGPCYSDKASRLGVRFEDLIDEKLLREKINEILPLKKKNLEMVHNCAVDFDADSVFAEYSAYGMALAKYAGDVSALVSDALAKGKKVLFEGAQGTFLDIDFGTYPYVTSSHPISGAAAVGVGIPAAKLNRIVGVVKAYSTRVGNGPFPAEMQGRGAEELRSKGAEFGTTTGRPRRVGWFDLCMLRTSQRLNGFTELAITKLDVLSGIRPLKVAVAYELVGKTEKYFPFSAADAEKAKPVYREFSGFTLEKGGKYRRIADLPKGAREYLKFISGEAGVPVKLVSIGADRAETIGSN
ncbi:MAG: adenylosuccinate synthetase [Candidatus Diapherotrites archaeon]